MKNRDPATELPNLIATLGTPEFFSQLLSYIKGICPIDHQVVFVFDQQLVPQLIEAKGHGDNQVAEKAGQIYTTRLFYRHDPNAMQVQSAEGKNTEISLLRMRADEIPDPEYKQRIYDQFQLIDRVSLLSQVNQHWFVINLYRDLSNLHFNPEELQVINDSSRLIIELCKKHFALLPASVWKAPSLPEPEMLQQLMLKLDAQLSERESEVCSYALIGVTNEGIALRLGIKPTTVATLRKRAFAKLEISSLNQLFGLCLGQLLN